METIVIALGGNALTINGYHSDSQGPQGLTAPGI